MHGERELQGESQRRPGEARPGSESYGLSPPAPCTKNLFERIDGRRPFSPEVSNDRIRDVGYSAAVTASESHPNADLELGPLLRKMVLGLLLFGVVLGGLSLFFRVQLLWVSAAFVDALGAGGVFLGWFIADGLTVPLPVDVFLALGLLGGLGVWEVFIAATLGSVLGALTGFFLGGSLRRFAWFERWWVQRGAVAEDLVERHGVTALVVAALSPLPFSIVCWAAGALRMPLRRFLPVCALRLIRVGVYLALIHGGLLSVV